MTRRDLCYLAGKRAAKLSPAQSAKAWDALARSLDQLGERDVPKFKDLLEAVRLATIVAKVRPHDGGPWTIEDPRMLREQIRISDKAFNHLHEDWRNQEARFDRLQDEYTAFRNAALKVTTEKTIKHFIQEQRYHVTPGPGV